MKKIKLTTQHAAILLIWGPLLLLVYVSVLARAGLAALLIGLGAVLVAIALLAWLVLGEKD